MPAALMAPCEKPATAYVVSKNEDVVSILADILAKYADCYHKQEAVRSFLNDLSD